MPVPRSPVQIMAAIDAEQREELEAMIRLVWFGFLLFVLFYFITLLSIQYPASLIAFLHSNWCPDETFLKNI